MSFSEKVKNEVKKKSCFRCVICHKPFVEIHHIVPQAEGGSDEPENAAPLCAGCHDLYGGNKEKRKQLIQMRDHWYELIEKRNKGELFLEPIETDLNAHNILKRKGIAIYHVVYEHEDFEITANILYKLLQNAQKQFSNYKRYLYLDIDGHRNMKNGFEHDMYELQVKFIMQVLAPFLTEIHMPLGVFKNNKLQGNDVFESLCISNCQEDMVFQY